MEGVSEAYHIRWGCGWRESWIVAALRRALDRIVARHEALRTTFVMLDGRAGAADRGAWTRAVSSCGNTICVERGDAAAEAGAARARGGATRPSTWSAVR